MIMLMSVEKMMIDPYTSIYHNNDENGNNFNSYHKEIEQNNNFSFFVFRATIIFFF